jgi:hypothetical protein
MSSYEQDIDIEVERLILRGLNMTPERGERLRALVEAELQKKMAQEVLPESLIGGELSEQDRRSIDLPDFNDDRWLASSVAERIAEGLHRDG